MVLVYGAVSASNDPDQALRARLKQLRSNAEVNVGGARIAARTLIPAFYERRSLQLAWTRPQRVRELLETVESSVDHGLDPGDFHVMLLRQMAGQPADGANAVDRDLVFTDALVRLAYHLRFGKANPRELYPGWNYSRTLGEIDPVAALEAILAAPRLRDAVGRFAPQLAAYRRLQRALARLREIEARGEWPRVPAGPTLKPGESGARIVALRRRLTAGSDLEDRDVADPLAFDAALETAVRGFQERHGISSDGVVGPNTLQALNVPVAARIEQVRVNLERLRWVAQELEGDYLLVDIAGFTARLFLDGREVWFSRTVVGRPYRRTPVFRATLRDLVLNPTWSVPPTILREDVVPKAARDPAFLGRSHMRIVDARGKAIDAASIDWSRYPGTRFPYQIVQAPSEDNALGRIKFLLPNPYAVYLHDTPSRKLFAREERAFSSGCIRLERPLELAVLLLDDAGRWSADAIRAAIASGETRTLRVKRQVPVMILYFTAEADEEGNASFNRDLYGRDARVAVALREPFRFAPVDRARRPAS